MEAISLQSTLVFGLLRYARNDKKTSSPHGTSAVRDDKLLTDELAQSDMTERNEFL